MKKSTWLLVAVFSYFYSSFSFAETPVKSTAENQTGVAVTVYNSNLGLVKDTRRVEIPKGEGVLQFMDVASTIMPVTVSVRSLNGPESFKVLEQNYEYDLMSQEKILDKYVGKNVKIINWNQYQDRKDTVEATLLSNEGQIYKINDEIYLGHPGTKVVSEIPGNLISKPTLEWLYENDGDATQDLEVSYLAANINWNADYVLIVNENDTLADLSGWVTVDNKSGATYEDAKLKLVAGQINRAQTMDTFARGKMVMMAEASAPFQEKAFFEYHIYDLGRKTTIKNNQTKQISLLEASGIHVEKEYLVRGEQYYYFQQYQNQDKKVPVQVFINFLNSKENNLGMPLPAGTMRLYKKDTDESQQFVGEDAIKHTPSDEKVRLKVGEAFDVVAERVQTDFKQVTSRIVESEWEITIRNHKEEDITVGIIEPLSNDWKILSSTHKYKKEDAFSARFDVPVSKKGEVKVQYRVSVEYP